MAQISAGRAVLTDASWRASLSSFSCTLITRVATKDASLGRAGDAQETMTPPEEGGMVTVRCVVSHWSFCVF